MRGPVLLTIVVASFSALRVISALAEEAACANSTGTAPITAASQPIAKREPSDVPRVERAARLAATGATATDVFKRMRESAARELAGRPDGVGDVSADELRNADDAIARQIRIDQGALPPLAFTALAKLPGRPQIAGLDIIYLNPLGDPARANAWKNIIVHQTKRGVTLWVETDGTVYWAVAENVIPTHGEGGDRNDNKYIDNTKTYHQVVKTNSIGVEFIGNYPDVAKPVTAEQKRAWLLLAPFLQERYGIAPDHIYAHNWIDFKDQRYCEGCELAALARKLGYCPSKAL